MGPVIRRYLPDLASDERLYDFQMESIVSAWLSELAAGWRTGKEKPEAELAEIGFLDAVRNAQVYSDAVAP